MEYQNSKKLRVQNVIIGESLKTKKKFYHLLILVIRRICIRPEHIHDFV